MRDTVTLGPQWQEVGETPIKLWFSSTTHTFDVRLGNNRAVTGVESYQAQPFDIPSPVNVPVFARCNAPHQLISETYETAESAADDARLAAASAAEKEVKKFEADRARREKRDGEWTRNLEKYWATKRGKSLPAARVWHVEMKDSELILWETSEAFKGLAHMRAFEEPILRAAESLIGRYECHDDQVVAVFKGTAVVQSATLGEIRELTVDPTFVASGIPYGVRGRLY
jgi:hypothetical protein